MKIIYRDLDYSLVADSFVKPGFRHNFLLFINENGKRLVYSVQMAVNYISTLPTASFDQLVDEQTFVACLPISEYPEILDYLEGGAKILDTYQLADNEAKRLVDLITKLLNKDKTVNDKLLLDRVHKLSQHTRLLEIEIKEKPQSVYTFDELYHTFLNQQRVFKDSLNHKIEARKLSSSLHFYTSKWPLTNEDVFEINTLFLKMKRLKSAIKKYNYSWYAILEDDVEKYLERFSNVLH